MHQMSQMNSLEKTYKQKNDSMAPNSLWKVWNDHPTVKLPGTQYTIKGWSLASLRSNFYISELEIMLDAGLSGNLSPDFIFVTHQHGDHCANLPFHLINNGQKEGQIQVYAPSQSAKNMCNYIESLFQLNGEGTQPHRDPYSQKGGYGGTEMPLNQAIEPPCAHYQMNPVDPGTFELIIKKRKFVIEVIQCFHTVPCVGYGLNEKRRKLKKEYMGLPGSQIKELQKQGQEIYYEESIPFFCYLGDTDKRILSNQSLEKYQTLMIECTFFLDSDIDQAEKRNHMHFSHLQPYIESHPQITFILYHFSQRYKKQQIVDFFYQQNLPNVIAWTN